MPVDRVLRYAGPVLQERAMLAQHARRTKLRSSDEGRHARRGRRRPARASTASTPRRSPGTRTGATTAPGGSIARWPSGKATAQALWELDKARQNVTPHDDMAQYLCAERPAPGSIEAAPAVPGRGDPRYEAARSGHEPMRPAADTARRDRPGRGLGPVEPMTPAALARPSAPDPLRPDRLRPDSARPDRLRPDPLRPDARPDRLRPDPLRPDARPDRLRPDPLRPDAAARRGRTRCDPAAARRGRPTRWHRPHSTRAASAPDLLRPDARPEPARPDPIRSGRDALLASLERPLGAPRDTTDSHAASTAGERPAGPVAPPR